MYNGLILMRRIFFCKIPFIFRARQMWCKGTLQNSFTRINSLSRSRKIIVIVLIILLLLYFVGPSIFSGTSRKLNLDVHNRCLRDKLDAFDHSENHFDAFINHLPRIPGERFYPPYVGNGHLAASLDSNNGLFVRLNRALSIPVKYYPVVSTSIDSKTGALEEASALNIRNGIAYKIQVLSVDSGWRGSCVTVTSQFYAHRSQESVLIQDIRISNPSKNTVVIDLDQVGASGWTDANTVTKGGVNHLGEKVEYTMTSGLTKTQDPGYVIYVTVAATKVSEKFLSVPTGKTVNLHIVTVVHYSAPTKIGAGNIKTVTAGLESKVLKDLNEALKMDDKKLRDEHIHVWNILWESGFGISYSKASGALNGEKINSTIYYVLSNTPAPLHSVTSTTEQKTQIRKTLHYPDRCYAGHSTLHASTLWVDVTDEDDIARVTTTWMITLEKQMCSVMVTSGAEGVLQAMLLSLGSFRFANDHLEFAMEPGDLHRDLFFHRINYGNNTHVNVSVIVGDDNKANLYVALDRNDRPYYACDAGCIDPPVALSKQVQQFPVKLTKPLTSILYITADKIHMEELKHAIHVKEINEAPAHEHHVLALHRHGHHFGGLPTIFWVSIAALVVIFHLFLFKLIYNEYCQGQERFMRSRYNI